MCFQEDSNTAFPVPYVMPPEDKQSGYHMPNQDHGTRARDLKQTTDPRATPVAKGTPVKVAGRKLEEEKVNHLKSPGDASKVRRSYAAPSLGERRRAADDDEGFEDRRAPTWAKMYSECASVQTDPRRAVSLDANSIRRAARAATSKVQEEVEAHRISAQGQRHGSQSTRSETGSQRGSEPGAYDIDSNRADNDVDNSSQRYVLTCTTHCALLHIHIASCALHKQRILKMAHYGTTHNVRAWHIAQCTQCAPHTQTSLARGGKVESVHFLKARESAVRLNTMRTHRTSFGDRICRFLRLRCRGLPVKRMWVSPSSSPTHLGAVQLDRIKSFLVHRRTGPAMT